jgi:diaminohydroxyphosphoribosylaminopyrimidine deaminase/5-amino-6-(5-phosphoribosylamino)uracil reductase
VRDPEIHLLRQPLRVVADSGLRIPLRAAMFDVGGEVQIFHTTGSTEREQELSARGVLSQRLQGANGRVDPGAMLDALGKTGCNRLLVEAGLTLNGALLAAGLVDEIIVYQSARIMGTDARGMFAIEPITQMQDLIQLKLIEVRHLGDDLRLTYRMA